MQQRARSEQDKARRSEDLLLAAQAIATELGGVRHVTLAAVTERVGLHPSAVRRYFASKEELLLELAERGWGQWRDAIGAEIATRSQLSPAELASIISSTIASLPTFCDLLTHIPLSLEGDVDLDRARRYKTSSFAAYDEIVESLNEPSGLSVGQIEDLLAAAVALTANFWQLSNPTPTLARLYDDVPRWQHAALDFEPRLARLLTALATGLPADPPRPAVTPAAAA